MIITIINQKGGVAKTTSAANLSAALAMMHRKVLCIDLDPQGNLSTSLGIEHSQRKNNIYEVLVDMCTISQSISGTFNSNLDCISANIDLSAFQVEFAHSNKKELILKNQLSDIDNQYDYIIIDSPPSLGLLAINALVASQQIIIPMQCEFLSLEGLSYLMQTVKIIQTSYNKDLNILGILLTMYDKRNRISEIVANDIISCLGDITFDTIIPRNVKVAEAPSHGRPVVVYDNRSPGAIAYTNLAKEIDAKFRR